MMVQDLARQVQNIEQDILKHDSLFLSGRKVLILYGTETGTSQDLAEDLSRRLQRIRFAPTLDEMNGVQLSSLLNYTFVAFIISTTGQGDLPRNARVFWKSLLRKRLTPTSLSQLTYATFGIGDSKYPQFNWAVRKLQKRLSQLGATQLVQTGEADEQHPEGIDGTFLPWAQRLRDEVIRQFPLPSSVSPIPDTVLLPPLYDIEIVSTKMKQSHGLAAEEFLKADLIRKDNSTTNIFGGETYSDAQVDCGNMLKNHHWQLGISDEYVEEEILRPRTLDMPGRWIRARVLENKRVTHPDWWQDVRRLILYIPRQPDRTKPDGVFKFNRNQIRPGCTIVMHPKNFSEDVSRLIKLMEWEDAADAEMRFRYESEDMGDFVLSGPPRGLILPASPFTLRDLLTNSLDITAIPKRSFFEMLWHFTEDNAHKDRLREFTDPKLIDEFFDYTSRPRRTMLEVLEEFTSVKIPLEYVTSIFPPMRGREYSMRHVQTYNGMEEAEITIDVALVKYKTVLQKVRRGLCSRYVESLKENSLIQVKMAGEPWPLPLNKPVLAVATGTGSAPVFFAFESRASLRARLGAGKSNDNLFFYGCRHPDRDCLLDQEEMAALDVYTQAAFSRHPIKKYQNYVQDCIKSSSNLISRFVMDEASILICGSAGNMPKAVRQALADALVHEKTVSSEEEAHQKLEKLIWEETW